MAQFLNTKDVSSCLEDIIRDASEYLVIISPYLKINDRIKKLLEIKDIEIDVLYRKDKDSKLDLEEKKWLDSVEHIETRFLQKLHAKCYLNENYAIVTSMNLYQSSEDNQEMGILVSIDEDHDLYWEIFDEAGLLLKMSKPETAGKTATKRGRRGARQAAAKPDRGFCIRCKTDLPANPAQPYCIRCYAIWRRFSDAEYKEKHCHTCGKEHTTTMSKPVCIACFRKYKDVLEFAAG